MAAYEGVYDFTHAGGTFDVHLRPGGRFFAPQFQADSTWKMVDDKKMAIAWGNFGNYELAITGDESPPAWEGSAVGDAKNWRKMKLKRPFSDAESKLFDSVWDFSHPGGNFEIQFRADGYNHFVCKDFPAHSHWSLTGNKLYINWGSFGEYDLVLDDSGESMKGSLKGNADSWRKGTRKGKLSPEQVADAVERTHTHGTGCSSGCSH